MNAAFEEQVRQRAYEIWVDLGRADGHARDHWLAAERDILASVTAVASAEAGKGRGKPVAKAKSGVRTATKVKGAATAKKAVTAKPRNIVSKGETSGAAI